MMFLSGVFVAVAFFSAYYFLAPSLPEKFESVGTKGKCESNLDELKRRSTEKQPDKHDNQRVNNYTNTASQQVLLPQRKCNEDVVSSHDVDVVKVQEVADRLFSESLDERREAIALLSQIGTRQQKEIIKNYALNTREPIAIRITALENIDWKENRDALANIILRDDDARESVIYMASAKELPQETRESIEGAMLDVFQSKSPSTQLAVLTYFNSRDSDNFDTLAEQIDWSQYAPDEAIEAKRLLDSRAK